MSNVFQEFSDAMASAITSLDGSIVSVEGRRRLAATGIAWHNDVIITAHHILERDDDLRVTDGDGTTYEAVLVGRDPANDLAVLRVEGASFTPASWADDDALQVGNLVLALGRPSEQIQATLGVVSARVNEGMMPWGKHKHGDKGKHEGHGRGRRRMSRMRRMMGRILADGFIQTDVTMYPGFSGGALISGDGKIHGLNTSGFGRGASIAVPVATIRKTVDTLLSHGRMRQGYLGVGIQSARLPDTIANELEQEMGLLVVSVADHSPATTAGIFVGDILTAIADEGVEQVDELMLLLTGDRVGQTVTAQIVRGGALQTVDITIAERE